MSKAPFMPLWVADFLGDTLDLDASEVGAYLLLLMAQWQRGGGSLPSDPKKLQRIVRCGRSWDRVWANIGRYFDADADGIYSNRLRLEATNVAAKREANAHNGARGGNAKALNAKKTHLADATIPLQQNASIPEPYPEREEREAKASCAKVPEGFADFWELVPRKVAKPAAQRAYSKALRSATAAQIIAGMRAYADSRIGQDPQYTAHPATWLNAGRWTDQPDPPKLSQITGGNHGKPTASANRLSAFLSGAAVETGMDFGQDRDPSQPLLARR